MGAVGCDPGDLVGDLAQRRPRDLRKRRIAAELERGDAAGDRVTRDDSAVGNGDVRIGAASIDRLVRAQLVNERAELRGEGEHAAAAGVVPFSAVVRHGERPDARGFLRRPAVVPAPHERVGVAEPVVGADESGGVVDERVARDAGQRRRNPVAIHGAEEAVDERGVGA